MMDFLDPKKSRAHTIRLMIGYVLMAVVIILATTILLYVANGFGVKQGKVIQNGLVYLSSNPSGSSIYLNGTLQNSQSNARLVLPAGTYTMKLSRDGYRDWQRAVTVEGGSVDRFDYPLLIPTTLATTAVASYASAPPMVTQSPDRRWLLVQQPGGPASFDVYDTKDPKKIKTAKKTIGLPAAVAGLPLTAASSFKMVEWSNDNDHVLLQHTVADQSEYILLSLGKPEESVNLTRQLQLPGTSKLSLQDKKYDYYYAYDSSTQTLSTIALGDGRSTVMLKGVVSFKTYGSNVVVYTTIEGANQGKISVKLYQNSKSYPIRQIAQDTSYLLDISRYNSSWYIVAGSPADNHVYIYQDPATVLDQSATQVLAPIEVLKLPNPNYVEFSANSKYIMAENGQDVMMFNVDTERLYTHQLSRPIDAPQSHITWMDGDHLRYVSAGVATIFDYDGTNLQSLAAASPAYVPAFDTAYSVLYSLSAPASAAAAGQAPQYELLATPLRTPRDQ